MPGLHVSLHAGAQRLCEHAPLARLSHARASFEHGRAEALALYFREQQWPLLDASLAAGGGYLLRWSFQQLQLHMGLWLAVPMLLPNLTSAILAIVYTEEASFR